MPQLFRIQRFRSSERQAITFPGGTVTFRPPRDYVYEYAKLVVVGTVGTAAATLRGEGWPALIGAVKVQGTWLGESYSPINSISGINLYDYAQFKAFALPTKIQSNTATHKIYVEIPIWFKSPRLSGDLSMATCLPAHQMTDLAIQVTAGAQADIDSNATPTFATSDLVCYIEYGAYEYKSVPTDFPFVKTGLDALSTPYTTTGQQELKLPAGGYYANILFRDYASTGVKAAAPTGATAGTYTVTPLTGKIRLLDLGRRIKMEVGVDDLRNDNLAAVQDTLVSGNYCMRFSGPAGMLLDTEELQKVAADVLLQMDITGNTTASITTVYDRIFDVNGVVRAAVNGGAR